MASRRTFTVVRQGAEALSKIPNPRQAVFFDIDEDVSLVLIYYPIGLKKRVPPIFV